MPTIWITGGKGFIGRHLARRCAERGAAVAGIGHGLWPAGDAAHWSFSHWINGEIESSNLTQLARAVGPPDTVFHLAGGSSVGLSLQNPLEDFTRTVETTARLLEWTRIHAAEAKIVAVSSAAVYGASHSRPIPESAPIRPYSPYGHHKSMMEALCRSYGENFGLRAAIVRLFSVYGEELHKQLLWDICCKLDARESAPLLLGGTGREIRDWLHVSDAVSLLWMARQACSPECPAMNGGTGQGTAVMEVARTVCEAWHAAVEVRFSGLARPGDPERLIADTAKATSMSFAPAVPFVQGIRRTVDWFRSRAQRAE
jgi:UDP-glucose 4-epimerase